MPSRLDNLCDEYSFEDLKLTIRLRTDEEVIKHNQMYETLQLVASAALGGKPKKRTIETFDQAAQSFQSAFGG